MDDFHRLLGLTRAAENCNGNARTFIRWFSKVLPYSRDSCAAQRQASVQWHRAQGLAMLLEGAMEAWEEHSDVLDYIGQAVGVSAPPLFVDGLSYQTAHEAAYHLADAVLSRFRDSGGDDDTDACRDLAKRLADFGGLPDLYGRIQGESFEAGNIFPMQITAHSKPDEPLLISENSRPTWSPETKILSFFGAVRKFSEQARNVCVVLDAFEESGWPSRMDDPDPRGEDPIRVQNTVATLNSKSVGIKFGAGDGGKSYIWERVEETNRALIENSL